MAEESDLELFLSDIKEDPNYKKFRLVVKGVREKLKIERLSQYRRPRSQAPRQASRFHLATPRW